MKAAERNEFLHGAVLKITREDTLPDIEKHLSLMKETGFNIAVIWPSSFWWEEKKEGYPFNTGKEILRIAERLGMKIIMELAGQISSLEYMPDFLMKKEYYSYDENGNINRGYDSYGFLNFLHPEVNDIICKHFSLTARTYRDFPALLAYDVFNETNFNSQDEHTIAQFRVYLKNKYKTIENLNRVWERTYTDLEQVDRQSWMWLSVMCEADWAEFYKSTVGIFLRNWCDAVKKEDGEHYIIADNIHSMVSSWGYQDVQNDFQLNEVADEIGMSFYPKGQGGCFPKEKRQLIFDSFYAATGRNGFYVSEMQTHTQAIYNPNTTVYPHELKTWCCEALSAGAKGLIYWMWRPFTKGLQSFSRGLVDHKDRTTPRLDVAREIGSLIDGLGGDAKPIRSRGAILYDLKCEIMQRTYTKAYGVDKDIYISSIHGLYAAMHSSNARCDITTIDDIDNYSLLFLTNHIVIDEKTAKKLKNYVKNGGVLICDGKCGLVNDEAVVHRDIPAGAMNDCFGIDYIDTDYQALVFDYDGKKVNGYYSKEIVEPTGATTIASFECGRPAVTVNSYGKGKVVSIQTQLWYGYHKTSDASILDFAKSIAKEYSLSDHEISAPLSARICETENGRVAFIFNYSDADVIGHFKSESFDCDVSVKANDVIVISEEK